MPELASNALIDCEYYKLYKGIDLDDSEFDDQMLNQFINQASTLIEHTAGRKFISGTETELFDGDSKQTYIVKQKRITSLTSLSYWTGTEWTAITAPTYTFASIQDKGQIYFTDGNTFFKSTIPYNWKAVYAYGWSRDGLPQDIKEACCEIVKWLYWTRSKAGVSSETLGDKNTGYSDDITTIPPSAMETIQRYKRIAYA